MISKPANPPWPALPYGAWRETCETLHLWTQIIGKVRLAYTPWLNHSWHVTLYACARGLTTSVIPHEARPFEIVFDFQHHVLDITTLDGSSFTTPLKPMTVADFYASVMAALADLGIHASIRQLPCEIPNAISFSRDAVHSSYDADYVHRFWQVLLNIDRVLKRFRTGFIGKCSPVHFFWGSFDMAVTRFSGRRAPLHAGHAPGVSDLVMQEAYSHELSSAGFWPGGGGTNFAAFYSYAYPQPAGFRDTRVEPDEAYFDPTLGEFLLPYEAVRATRDPGATLLAFLESTYRAAATCGNWSRAALECPIGQPGVPRPLSANDL